jgi:hypothetical protein
MSVFYTESWRFALVVHFLGWRALALSFTLQRF